MTVEIMNNTSKLLLKVAGLLGVIVLTVVITLSISGKNGGTIVRPDPLKPGETSEVANTNPPTSEIDPARLQVTYKPGKTYVNKVIVQVNSSGTYKDWGVNTKLNFTYLGEFQFSRHIVSNDGKRLVADVVVDKAVTITSAHEVEAFGFEPPEVIYTLINGAALLGGGIPLQSKLVVEDVNRILSPIGASIMNAQINDSNAKTTGDINSLTGKKARVVFENGKGIVSITAIGNELSPDERAWFEGLSVVSDIAMMESLECKPGDQWLVAAKDLMPLVDPSLVTKTSGSIVIERGKDIGTSESPTAVLSIARGAIEIRDRYESDGHKKAAAGTWAPKGDIVFDFTQGIVTAAELTGAINYTEESLDHILFEMKHTQRPTYKVTYDAWVVDGPAKAPALMDPPENLKRRLSELTQ